VVPWADGEVDAWVLAANPELLNGAKPSAASAVLDPVVVVVVVEALRSLSLSVNHSNNLAGALDKRDAVVTLTTLHRGGYTLDVDGIYTRAMANRWPARGAERLLALPVWTN
jgi:hypothetical protein